MLALTAFFAAASPVQAVGLHCTATDGDTLACGPKRVRAIGLDAPEMRARCPAELALAVLARDRLAKLIEAGVTLHARGRDRYTRLLAMVLDARGRDVAVVLIGEGLARPYGGRGRRPGWCEPAKGVPASK